ncbi:MAG: serine protease [Planctomycetes bacterium]|nr:serine protease [Planctomycetota bacterium]
MAITVQTGDGRTIVIDGEAARIGSDPGCEIAFPNDARLRGQHARLKNIGDRWLVEATEDGRIQVGDAAPARMKWLEPAAAIRLTDSGPTLIFQPAGDAAPRVPRPPALPQTTLAGVSAPPSASSAREVSEAVDKRSTASAAPAAPRQWSGRMASTAIAMAAVALLAVVVVWAVRGTGREVDDGTAAQAAAAASQRNAAGENDVVQQPEGDQAAEKTPPVVPEHALYWVLVKDAEEEQVYRLGTAWAASEHHLVTSATIATAVEQLAANFPIATVRCPLTKQEFDIETVASHAGFTRAYADLQTAEAEADALRRKLEQDQAAKEAADSDCAPAQPLLSDDMVTEMIDRLVELAESRFQALERQAYVDVGVIRVRGALPVALPTAGPRSKPRGGDRVTVLGIAFDEPEVLIFPDETAVSTRLPGRILKLPRPSGAARPRARLAVQADRQHSTENWLGSPVLNADGEVVGIYSRLAPPIDPSQPPRGDVYDAAEMSPLRELEPALARPPDAK